MSSKWVTFLIVLGTILLPHPVSANPLYLNAASNYDGAGGAGFVAYYNSRQAGMGDKLGTCFNCNVCHTSVPATDTNLNKYANDWLNAWKVLEPGRTFDQNPDSFSVTAWQNIESVDSDGDGPTNSNIAEIMAGSNPGDPNSTPNAPNCTQVSVSGGSGGGGAYTNPNTLNAKCSTAPASVMLTDKGDAKRDIEDVLLYLAPIFMIIFLKVHLRRGIRA